MRPFDQAHDKKHGRDRSARRCAKHPSTVRFARPRIEKAFFENAQAYQQLLRQEASRRTRGRATAAPQSADELSLLEESEFEDWLNLTGGGHNRLESDGVYGAQIGAWSSGCLGDWWTGLWTAAAIPSARA